MLELITGRTAAETEVAVRGTLDELAREGARRMIEVALQVEVEEDVSRHRRERDAAGHAVVVRNGTARPRTVTTGVGPIPVAAPRVNDRRIVEGQRQRFTSAILPPYLRRSPRLAGVLPLLYLHGLSAGDFREALPALLGPEAAGLAPSTITRLTKSWTAEYEAFRRRDLAERDYVYLWADMLTADACEAFNDAGSLYDKSVAKRYYQTILSVGNSVPPDEAFRRFRGRDVDTDALMRERGFPVSKI